MMLLMFYCGFSVTNIASVVPKIALDFAVLAEPTFPKVWAGGFDMLPGAAAYLLRGSAVYLF